MSLKKALAKLRGGANWPGAGRPAAPHHPLEGDRCVEWGWILDHLPRPGATVLDVGCNHSVTAGIAAIRGLLVTGLDLQELGYGVPNLRFEKGDVLQVKFPADSFDAVVLCSTVEHLGLAGRYGSVESTDGDLDVMRRVRGWLKPGGRVLLTIPVGLDGEFRPFHRVYGTGRLPLLLKGYAVIEEEYWVKEEGVWARSPKAVAQSTRGRDDFYSLGLLVLGREV